MDMVFTPGAGLDVHQKTVMACRVTPDPTGQQGDGVMEVQEFGTRTCDLLALSDWLAAAGITHVAHVAMESTGEYWKPVYHILEGDYTVFLIHAAHVTQVPGRKTDKHDARWLAKLMCYGLLQASFIPSQGQRDRRDLTRDRTTLVQERRREVNRVPGVLERANSKLAAVATDVMGVSGRAILAALVEGRAAPATRAELAKGRLRSKIPLLEQALTGLMRAHHRRLLAMQLAHMDFLDEPIDALNADSARRLMDLGPGEPPRHASGPGRSPGKRGRPRPRPHDLSSGGDRARHHSWSRPARRGAAGSRVGDRPGPLRHRRPPGRLEWRGTGPRRKRGETAVGEDTERQLHLCTVLTQLAPAAARAKGTYLSAWYQRLAARRGKKRAIMAVAHSIVVSACHRLSRHQPHHELGVNSCDARRRDQLVDRLARRIEHLGYRVTLEAVTAS